MSRGLPRSPLQKWLGFVAGVAVLVSASLLLAVYLHSRVVFPRDKALIDSLKEKGKTDPEIQKVLQPEMNRQHEADMVRRTAYDRTSLILVFSALAYLAWLRWLRPEAQVSQAESRKRRGSPAVPGAFPKPPGPSRAAVAVPQELPPEAIDLAPVDEIIRSEGRGPEAAIPILQAIQSHYRYLPEPALRRVCQATDITASQIAGVASFYGQFRLRPMGEHLIRVCEGTACHVSGAVEVGNELRRCLGVHGAEDTDPTKRFTIERVACLGSCSLAPIITIDEKIYGHVSALSAGQVLQDFLAASKNGSRNGNGRYPSVKGIRPSSDSGSDAAAVEIRIGLGSCGIASGAQQVYQAFEQEIGLLGGGAWVKAVGCSGLCHREPLVEVVAGECRALYGNITAGDVRKIVRRHVRPRKLSTRVREDFLDVRARLLDDRSWVPIAEQEVDAAPYMQKQVRIVLENCGIIHPLSLDEYRQRGGMLALEACLLRQSPGEVVESVRASGLRGRGGAGFPTGIKWEITRGVGGNKKYVICNGDEGDPGAFMDRALLEADPFRVLEGLAIAAYAVGSDEGYLYVRREYPIAVKHVRAAIGKAEEQGFLGERILGTEFNLKLHVREGAGAFVCGEETALIQSIEGQRGMPKLRPPYPAQSGLWGKPTLINNVETLACVPWILRRGPQAFAALGTGKSKGTKVFSLAGKVRRGGLIEVPMGITIREIVEQIGGGIKDGRQFKAVLIGGPSGGCIPSELADTRVDYEELASTGAIMGSGGLVVLDERDCAVEIARYFLQFTQSESCGKCTYCRIGTKRMLEILERICAGQGRESDLRALEDLSVQVKMGSLCGLGQTAPNPVLTTLRYFRAEYAAHILEKRCPAAQCKALIHFTVQDNCTGCTLCAQACPVAAIETRPYEIHEVIDDLCTRCGMCVTACPEDAILVK